MASTKMNDEQAPQVGVWALSLGAIGFAAGFIGPITFNPDANQGPLLGIFITGPAGALIGAVLGMVCRWIGVAARQQRLVLLWTGIFGGFAVLFFCLPDPKTRGYVLEAKVQSCDRPVDRIDSAIDYWDKRIAAVTWSTPRAGWKQDAKRMLEEEGAVVTISITREGTVFENRKPWNRGTLGRSAPRKSNATKAYFVRFAGSDCANYSERVDTFYVAADQGSKEWPPADLQNFLGVALLEPLPESYRQLK